MGLLVVQQEPVHLIYSSFNPTMGGLLSTMSEAGGRGAAHEASSFFQDDIRAKFNEASSTMTTMRDTLGTADTCISTVKYCWEMSTIISASCTAYQTWDEARSKARLAQLGEEIANNFKHIDQAINIGVNLDEPEKLSQHVYCVSERRMKEMNATTGQGYFFVFHPGNNWHSEFEAKLSKDPLPGLCGIFDNIATMAAILLKFREVVGPTPVFYILVPTAHVYVVPDQMDLPTQLEPFKIFGERGRNQKPFVYLTGGDEWERHVLDVGVLKSPRATPTLKNGDKARMHIGAAAAGGGGAAAGMIIGSVVGPGGTILGGVVGGALAGPAAKDDIKNKRIEVRKKELDLQNATILAERAAMR